MFQIVAMVDKQAGVVAKSAQDFDPLARHDQDGIFPAFVDKPLAQGVPGRFTAVVNLPLDDLKRFTMHVHGVGEAHIHHAHPAAHAAAGAVIGKFPNLNGIQWYDFILGNGGHFEGTAVQRPAALHQQGHRARAFSISSSEKGGRRQSFRQGNIVGHFALDAHREDGELSALEFAGGKRETDQFSFGIDRTAVKIDPDFDSFRRSQGQVRPFHRPFQ